jgi:light-regulated signal transduction histidine kinase (bacteriophytochrome)
MEINRNITARKRVEEALQQAHDELEIRVTERTAELVRSNTEMQQLTYVASHDLQEPLRMIASYLELLVLEYGERLDAEAHEYIAYAIEGAVRMKSLINDLLTFSRVGTQGKPMESTSVNSLLIEVLADLQQGITETNAVITCDPLPIVSADSLQLKQVLRNLIGNAIKFHGTEAPHIHLSVTAADGAWRFSVADNGIGIQAKHAERIFVIFQRLHNKSKYSGTGVGLAVCKRVIERHGGRIWVESEPGKGSTFCFTLPQFDEFDPKAQTT